MENILRSLSFNIDQFLYPLIPSLYQIFYDIASEKYFETADINRLANNIYIVLCVCMLFALGLKLLSAIVNPEILSDGKKGVKGVFFRSVFAVFLIILIPIGFNIMLGTEDTDGVQKQILDNQLIEKIVLGIETDEDSDPGQALAAYAFQAFCYPNDNVSVESLSSNGYYQSAIESDISDIQYLDDAINSQTDGEYDLVFHALLSPAVAIYLLYQLVILCMDTALRTIKLGLLQLIAPIILCGYVVAGTDILKKWAIEVGKTFILLFLKIAAVSFMVFGLSMLPSFLEKFEGNGFWYRGLLYLFVLIGLLQLIAQFPTIINTIFGTNIKSRGGIAGRLGEMAAVGDLAQRGWNQLRTHPVQTTRRLAAAPANFLGAGISHNVAAAQRAAAVRARVLRETGSVAAANRAAALSMAGGILTTGGAMIRAGQTGFRTGTLQGIGEQAHRYTDTHPANSDLTGRIDDRIRTGLGLRTREEERLNRYNTIEFDNPNTGLHERIGLEELQARQKLYGQIRSSAGNIKSTIENSMKDEGSGINIIGGSSASSGGLAVSFSGNYHQIANQIATLDRTKVVDESTGNVKISYGGSTHTLTADEWVSFKDQLDRNLTENFVSTRDAKLNDIMTKGDADASNIAGFKMSAGEVQSVNAELAHMTDILGSNDEMFNAMQQNNNGANIGQNNKGLYTFTGDFMKGAMQGIFNYTAALDRAVNKYNDQITADQTSHLGREEHASNQAVHAGQGQNNGNGGNGGNGNP